jgi:hypothetical protein
VRKLVIGDQHGTIELENIPSQHQKKQIKKWAKDFTRHFFREYVPGMVVHVYNLGTWELEAGGIMSSRTSILGYIVNSRLARARPRLKKLRLEM